MNKFARFVRVPAGAALAFVGAAHAAVPAEVTTKMADMATDGASMATLGLLAVIAISAILFLRRAAK